MARETTGNRWKRRPEGSTWGDYGADDQLGRLNELTAEKVLAGVAEVKTGKTFCLSLPLDYPGGNVLNPRRHGPVIRPTRREDSVNFLFEGRSVDPNFPDVVNDDLAVLHLQYSTQWDSFAHVGSLFDADGDGKAEAVFYNGYRAGKEIRGPSALRDSGGTGTFEAKTTTAVEALSVAGMAEKCIQGRAVLIDLHAHFGRERRLVGYNDIMGVMAADGIKIEPGDLLCLRTGFDRLLLEMGKSPDKHRVETSCSALDGTDQRLLDWIGESRIAALIADNYAVEAFPARAGSCAMLPLHQHCLFKLGLNLGELWQLSDLADWLRANNRSRFLLTAPPLRLPGAVGSPATPVATV